MTIQASLEGGRYTTLNRSGLFRIWSAELICLTADVR